MDRDSNDRNNSELNETIPVDRRHFLQLFSFIGLGTSYKLSDSVAAELSIETTSNVDSSETEWQKEFSETSFSSVIENDNGYTLSGSLSPSATGTDENSRANGIIMRLDSQGNQQWMNEFGGIDPDYFSEVIESDDGGYILVGTTQSFADSVTSGVWVVKTDKNGEKKEENVYEKEADSPSVVKTNDGGYLYVTTLGLYGGDSTWVAKMNKRGSKQWGKTINTGSAKGVIPTNEGYLIFGSRISGYANIWLCEIDLNGTKLWEETFGNDDKDTYLHSVKETRNGNYIVLGEKSTNDGRDAVNWLLSVDSGGQLRWDTRLNKFELANSMIVTSDGGLILGGESTTEDDGWFAKIIGNEESKRIAWERTFDIDVEDRVNGLIETSDGGYLLTGVSDDGDWNRTGWVIKLETLEQGGFDPQDHGFGFPNWESDGEDLFSPSHNHTFPNEQAVIDVYSSLPSLQSYYIPPEAREAYAEYMYEIGAATKILDEHCLGMVFASKEYYESGVPESIPAEKASQISQPTGEYERVGDRIDELMNEGLLDENIIKKSEIVTAPESVAPLDLRAEINQIRTRIEEDDVAVIGLGDPESGRGHAVLAYECDLDEQGRVSGIYFYDPNYISSNEIYEDPGPLPISYENGSVSMGEYPPYTRMVSLDGLRDASDILTGQAGLHEVFRDAVDDAVGGLVNIIAHSPIKIDAIGPDGRELSHPSEPVDGKPPEEICYAMDATAGEYKIEVTGTGSGSYEIEVQGLSSDNELSSSTYSGNISEGDTQELVAELSEDNSSEGEQSVQISTPEQTTTDSTPDDKQSTTEQETDIVGGENGDSELNNEGDDSDNSFGLAVGTLGALGGGSYLAYRQLSSDSVSESYEPSNRSDDYE